MSRFSGSSSGAEPHAERIRVEQVAALYRNVAVGPGGALVAAIILAAVLVSLGGVGPLHAVLWVIWGFGCVGFHMALRHFYRRSPLSAAAWRSWGWAFTLASVFDGLWWGYGATWLVSPHYVEGQLLANMVATAVAVGAALAYGNFPPAFQGVLAPIVLATLAWNLQQGDRLHLAVVALILVFAVVVNVFARRAYLSFVDTLRTRFEKDALAQDLRLQKELAEQANLSKSRFLAAASHDLRQPVHALGMFVGALAAHPMSEDMRRLVAQIEGSVAAMDGLFNALLDISKLDAGVVQTQVQAFPVGPLLARLCEDFQAEARRKGLALVHCPCSAVVVSDPVLLERVVRNILANAVRYTDAGRILLGCRRGAWLRIEVWNTGRGIAEKDAERVFQEFYQVDNFERDRGKGLGLGLAIVKRLTALLGHPISLESALGRGTTFRLSVPLAPAAALVERPAAPLARDFAGALILVVDDELMVQEAMRRLLTSWGCEAVVASSGEELLQRLAGCASLPDLILCDYRLPGQDSGIDVIRRIRAQYNDDIPAILITGDTAPERLQEAHDSGFLVLSKPVANSKLRAAIGNAAKRRLSAPQEAV